MGMAHIFSIQYFLVVSFSFFNRFWKYELGRVCNETLHNVSILREKQLLASLTV